MPDLAARPWEWYAALADADEKLLTPLERRKPYAYGGTGVDQLAGQYGDADLDAAAPVIVRGTAPGRKDATCARD